MDTPTAVAPAEIFKHCLTCRQPTLHARVAGIPSRLLYACTAGCKTPAREVSEPERDFVATDTLKEMHRVALKKSVERQQQQAAAQPRVKKPRKETPVPKPQPQAVPQDPFTEAIDRRVRAQLAELLPGLLPKVLIGLLSVAAPEGESTLIPTLCSRPVHKLRYGKPCCEKASA